MDEARSAFEAWARGPAGYVDDQLARYADGSYQDSLTLSHWAIWRAAWKAANGVQVVYGSPTPKPPCTVCGKPYEQHGTYPTCASHPYTPDGRCGAVGTLERGQFAGVPCPGAECTNGCVRAALGVPAVVPSLPLPSLDPRVSALRWLLNITTEHDRKDVRTRQTARLLDEFSVDGQTNRELLEDLWRLVSGNAGVTASGGETFSRPDADGSK